MKKAGRREPPAHVFFNMRDLFACSLFQTSKNNMCKNAIKRIKKAGRRERTYFVCLFVCVFFFFNMNYLHVFFGKINIRYLFIHMKNKITQSQANVVSFSHRSENT